MVGLAHHTFGIGRARIQKTAQQFCNRDWVELGFIEDVGGAGLYGLFEKHRNGGVREDDDRE